MKNNNTNNRRLIAAFNYVTLQNELLDIDPKLIEQYCTDNNTPLTSYGYVKKIVEDTRSIFLYLLSPQYCSNDVDKEYVVGSLNNIVEGKISKEQLTSLQDKSTILYDYISNFYNLFNSGTFNEHESINNELLLLTKDVVAKELNNLTELVNIDIETERNTSNNTRINPLSLTKLDTSKATSKKI